MGVISLPHDISGHLVSRWFIASCFFCIVDISLPTGGYPLTRSMQCRPIAAGTRCVWSATQAQGHARQPTHKAPQRLPTREWCTEGCLDLRCRRQRFAAAFYHTSPLYQPCYRFLSHIDDSPNVGLIIDFPSRIKSKAEASFRRKQAKLGVVMLWAHFAKQQAWENNGWS